MGNHMEGLIWLFKFCSMLCAAAQQHRSIWKRLLPLESGQGPIWITMTLRKDGTDKEALTCIRLPSTISSTKSFAGWLVNEAALLGRMAGNSALLVAGMFSRTDTAAELRRFSRYLYSSFAVMLTVLQILIFYVWTSFKP